MESRKSKLKKGIDRGGGSARRRELQAGFARRNRRQLLNKRRMMAPLATEQSGGQLAMDKQAVSDAANEIIKNFRSAGNDDEALLSSLRELTKLLSRQDVDVDIVIEATVRGGIIKDLIAMLGGATKSSDLQLQAAWCLTNIASGTHAQTELVLPACPAFIQALSGTNAKLKEHAIWAIGNIAGDSDKFRKAVIMMGAFVPFASIVSSAKNPEVLRTACWTLSNMLRGEDIQLSRQEFSKHANVFLEKFHDFLDTKNVENARNRQKEGKERSLSSGDNVETIIGLMSEVAWCLTYLTSRDEPGCGRVIEFGFPQRLSQLIRTDTPTVLLIPVLRCIGNMLAYNDKYNENVLSKCDGKRLLEGLSLCFKHEHRGLRKESIWVVGNILAGPPNHKDPVVKSGFIPELVKVLQDDAFDLRREALYALYNISQSKDAVKLLVHMGVIEGILDLMRIDDVDTIILSISFISNILELHPQGVQLVEEAGGIDALEHHQTHPNPDLWDRARVLVDKYWGEDDYDYGAEDNKEDDYPPWRLGAQQQGEQTFNFD